MGQVEAGVEALGVELTDSEAAALIRAVLQAEGEVALGGLAEEMGLSDRQFGMGLGLLILEGKAQISRASDGFVVRFTALRCELPAAAVPARR